MNDLLHALQNGSVSLWIFIPSAILLGAMHGLEPGHSKTMMAAFIVAIRGTIGQAVLLGLWRRFPIHSSFGFWPQPRYIMATSLTRRPPSRIFRLVRLCSFWDWPAGCFFARDGNYTPRIIMATIIMTTCTANCFCSTSATANWC
jgi:hypothetical protein